MDIRSFYDSKPRADASLMTNNFALRISAPILSIVALIAVFLPVSNLAQYATARITGTISDSTGPVIPGVQVTVTNPATQVSREVTSDHDGLYQALALPIRSEERRVGKEGRSRW